MDTFFTSDLHLGHNNIIKYCNRPFASVDEMNHAIVERWNEKVAHFDKVYILGDLAMGNLTESLAFVEQLNGIKYLVPGNHDRCWSGNKKVREADFKRYESVDLTILEEDFRYDDHVRLCHFPVTGDSHDEDRFDAHRPTLADFEWLVHGHVHEKWKVNGRQINVGVDVWDFYPVPESAIYEIIESEDN